MEEIVAARPTLCAWLREYEDIERDYLASLESAGLTFALRDKHAAEVAAARERVRAKGAAVSNGGASVVWGTLSSACVACTADRGSKTFFLSLACNRDCYFCFNVNQEGFAEGGELNRAWREEFDGFARSCGGAVTHVGLTGGEPLLHREEALAFLAHTRAKHPQAHTRLYTAGDFLDEGLLAALHDAGLSELRMSVKLDVRDVPRADAIIDEAVARLSLARRYIPAVMVEMPVIPGTAEPMRRLLCELARIGAFGINLLEFGYPMGEWEPFAERGFAVKNPPFPVLYDYGYAGGLPIEGSELLCLHLLEYAIDEGLDLGVHYCSLENKNRSEICQQNGAARLNPALYALDDEDFFYKAAKAFDGDVPLVREQLEALHAPFEVDAEEGSLLFHPRWIDTLRSLPVVCALSWNVLERAERGFVVRELKLAVV